jgi:hypothetical protein
MAEFQRLKVGHSIGNLGRPVEVLSGGWQCPIFPVLFGTWSVGTQKIAQITLNYKQKL